LRAGAKGGSQFEERAHSVMSSEAALWCETTADFGGHTFAKVAAIQPDRDARGNVAEFAPQSEYAGGEHLALHKYGGGSFCRFRIDPGLGGPGVYVLTVNGSVAYVGECDDLSGRFNMGYGQISPRNCFRGGQETNCRINALILQSAQRAEKIDLWFLGSAGGERVDRKLVEAQLVAQLKPPWNRA
jgi:hypothetical protein